MPQRPIVVVASLFIMGVLLGWVVELSLWALVAVGVVLFCGYWFSGRWWMAHLIVLFSGFTLTQLARYSQGDPSGEGYFRGEVVRRAEGVGGAARRGVVRLEGLMTEGDEQWRRCGAEVRFREAEGLDLDVGDRVVIWSRVWRFRGRYYANLDQRALLSVERVNEGSGERVSQWSVRVSDWAMRRLEMLGLDEQVEGLSAAMLLGRREGLSEELQAVYRRSGAAHILVVSGLHIAIVCLLFGWVFSALQIVPMGFRLRPLLTAAAVWGYAEVVGMSASVERAAVMFVMMQLIRLFGRRYSSTEAFVVAIALMMAIDPRLIFDLGFQLSVAAVGAVLWWFVPCDRALRRWIRGRYGYGGWLRRGCVRVALALFSMLFVGACCSVATMPLISWVFGYVSPLGVLLNPLVVTTAWLLLLLLMGWIFVGVGFLAPLWGGAIGWLAMVQIGAVEYMSSGWRDALELRITGVSVVVIYALYGVATVAVRRLSEQRVGDGQFASWDDFDDEYWDEEDDEYEF